MSWIPIGTVQPGKLKLHDDMRRTHMHVLGISQQGKSYFLEQMIRQDILSGNGVCVIDPHGELYDNVVRWIVANGLHETRTVHLLNPSDDQYTFGFNPLCVDNGVDLSTRVEGMVDACEMVWKERDGTSRPRLAKCLLATYYALAKWNLSLAEALVLVNAHKREVRKKLTSALENSEIESVWREFDEALSLKQFAEYFESSVSRLLPFIANPRIKQIVGQTENLLNFRKCMDKGHIVLVNLARSGKLSHQSSQLLGALLFNDMYNTAFGRDISVEKPRPFYCYVDECARYLTPDVAASLDETAKFGLHLILSHQGLDQLQEHGDTFARAIMRGAQTKVIFRVNDEDTAEAMSKHLFRKEFNLERPKHIMDKPVTVGYRPIWLTSESDSVTHISGTGSVEMSVSGSGTGLTQVYGADGVSAPSYTESSVDMNSSGSGTSSFEASGTGSTTGRHEAMEPILEERPTQLYSLEELIHEGMVALLSLPKRHAFIYGPAQKPIRFSTLDIRAGLTFEDEVKRVTPLINDASSAVSLRSVVQTAITRRADAVAEIPKAAVNDNWSAEVLDASDK